MMATMQQETVQKLLTKLEKERKVTRELLIQQHSKMIDSNNKKFEAKKKELITVKEKYSKLKARYIGVTEKFKQALSSN